MKPQISQTSFYQAAKRPRLALRPGRYQALTITMFDTDEGDTGLDSTVHVFEDNITDCGVNDDQEMIGELD